MNLVKNRVVGIHPIFYMTILLVAQWISSSALAENMQQKGFDIAARSDRSDRGFSDSEVKMTMVLQNAAGKKATRTAQTRVASSELLTQIEINGAIAIIGVT